MNYWQAWSARSTYKGRWREIVNRSALVLKLMTSQKYGSVVAAPTCGLPEAIGHGRNWDYRFTWVRDASFTVYALNRLGYNDEAGAFIRWIEDRCREMHPQDGLQLMYGIDGRRDLPEVELKHLDGYRGSKPRAHRQRRFRSAPARHLRRVDGLGLSLRQIRQARRLRGLAGHHQAHQFCLQKPPPQGRRHLGGARRQPGIPLLEIDVLGRRGPRVAVGRQTQFPDAAGSCGSRRATSLYKQIHTTVLERRRREPLSRRSASRTWTRPRC